MHNSPYPRFTLKQRLKALRPSDEIHHAPQEASTIVAAELLETVPIPIPSELLKNTPIPVVSPEFLETIPIPPIWLELRPCPLYVPKKLFLRLQTYLRIRWIPICVQRDHLRIRDDTL